MTPEYSTHQSNAASIVKNPSASSSSSPANSNASTPVKTTSVSAVNQTKTIVHPKVLPDRTISSNTSGIQSNVENVRVPPCCQMTAAVVSIVSAGKAGSSDECKKMSKFDSRLGPSPFRQLLPIALCILSFATVLSILIVYMDTTEIRHQQFRLNMSRDYEMYGVQQDDPTLIAFLREIHMKKYPMHFLKNSESGEHLNFTQRHEMTPEMAQYIANLVGSKSNGAFVQSMTSSTNYLMTAPWLAETLNWSGLIVEPEPRRYFSLRKQNIHRPKVQVVHACISPNIHPKEVTIHNEDSEVRINSLLDEETSWFNSRVKCFPLYTFMMAINRADYDLLSLGVPGHELQILETLPFKKVDIKVISVHLTEEQDNPNEHIKPITKFLSGKSYKMQKQFGPNYIYIKINANRSRKKDILLLRKP